VGPFDTVKWRFGFVAHSSGLSPIGDRLTYLLG
jgi:hypothetical protein